MNKLKLLLPLFIITSFSFGQSNDNAKLIELGKSYKDFMFRNEPGKEFIQDLKQDVPADLKSASEFIIETITTNNNLLTKNYLSLPDDQTLKNIFIIDEINLNSREENQINNNKLIDSLKNKTISHYELVDSYYGMLFTAVGNKIFPFDFSNTNFKLKEYNLTDDTDKGIFFLRCIYFCGKNIWGYMNVVKPPNTKKALEYIKRFPKFNGQPYFQFTDLYFPDFKMNIIKDEGLQSYKGYYIDQFYETLLSHLICLNKEGGTEKEKNDLLLGSILKDTNLYKYTKYKNTLEEIFKEQKKE